MKIILSILLYLAISIFGYAQEGESPNNYANQQVFLNAVMLL